MTTVIEVHDGFWNVRGSFRVGGIVELGTQMSLVRRKNGKYVLLDACGFDDGARGLVDQRTEGGDLLEAMIHLHPFHTLHVRAAHQLYPHAKLFGTARHVELLSDLPWENERTEDAALHTRYADDFDFTVPRGVELVSKDPNLHFGSVIAFHRESRTMHVDDTLIYARLPWPIGDMVRFHPTLAKVLVQSKQAASDFRSWARELIERSRTVDNLCAAHTTTLLGKDNRGAPIADRIEKALRNVEGVLAKHERRQL